MEIQGAVILTCTSYSSGRLAGRKNYCILHKGNGKMNTTAEILVLSVMVRDTGINRNK